MQHFSNYFVQILVIRSKCQGEQRWSRKDEKDSRGAAAPLLPAPMIMPNIMAQYGQFCLKKLQLMVKSSVLEYMEKM